MKLYHSLKVVHKLSKIFQPLTVMPKNAHIKKQDITSNSQRLMLELGIIRSSSPGCFHVLPLGLKALEKLTKLVDKEMQSIGAQKIDLSALTDANLWKKTGRLENNNELFTLNDRHMKMYVLSPTHEEAITDLIASVFPISHKNFPIYLYQVTSKFRDEIKPRFGLMRGRQFVMKDLYTFDIDLSNARLTYDKVCQSYNNIFTQLGVQYVKVLGTTGNIGGTISHEYHFPSKIGEDQLLLCDNCQYSANVELSGSEICPNCKSSDKIHVKSGIEVAHTFLLGDKYSVPLNAKYLSKDSKPSIIQMGCYGLGLSRILAASLELLSETNELRWPLAIAPYTIVIITPKVGSKEEPLTMHLENRLQIMFGLELSLKDEILFDDRKHMTIGKRLFEAKRVGYPFIIVIGDLALQNPPLYEMHDLISNQCFSFTEAELFTYVQNILTKPYIENILGDAE